jgi:tRNA (guanine37-N1)-methyltransferase
VRVDVVTIFPGYFEPLDLALVGKARAGGLLDLRVHDLRDWTTDPHRTVDDAPYGGGGGMVMRPEPWFSALQELRGQGEGPRIVIPGPGGRPFTHQVAGELAAEEWLILACGRYEGIDQRVIDEFADDEISVGDFVLAGGEAAALVIVEAVTRLLPGVVGNPASVADDSFALEGGLLEGPVYTRPAVVAGREVPEVLRSGDHGAVERWRAEQARERTARRRPDLI